MGTWRVSKSTSVERVNIVDIDGPEIIGFCDPSLAEQIVREHNEHDELVIALESLMELYTDATHHIDGEYYDDTSFIESTLQKAKGIK